MSVDTVLNFARDTRPADQYLYLLLDPLSACDEANPLHINSLAKRLGDAAVQRVPRPDLSHASEAFPVLITLAEPEDRPDEELLTRSHAYAADDRGYRKPYVCGWLTSRLPPEALAAHLVSFCQFSSQPDMEEFFPVFEPLRLELLASAARSEFASRLSPISHWLCPTSWGDFAVLTESRDTPQHLCLPLRSTFSARRRWSLPYSRRGSVRQSRQWTMRRIAGALLSACFRRRQRPMRIA